MAPAVNNIKYANCPIPPLAVLYAFTIGTHIHNIIIKISNLIISLVYAK
jgi:hypothetical protein